jgi:hypothetical protein
MEQSTSGEIVWGTVGAVFGSLTTGLGWLRERSGRNAKHAAELDAAVKEALIGLLWRPQHVKYNFQILASHLPKVRENHLRELLTGVGAIQEFGKVTRTEYWYLAARLNEQE